MIPQFDGLSEDEKQLMLDAIPLITVYIAGADGKIDEDEKAWSEKIANIRSFSYNEALQDYYGLVSETFSSKLDGFIEGLPEDVEARTKAIEEKLTGLNDILQKLDINFAARFYKTLRSFAKHVAKASGGIFGFGSISHEEDELLGLDFITPITIAEVDEEEENDEV